MLLALGISWLKSALVGRKKMGKLVHDCRHLSTMVVNTESQELDKQGVHKFKNVSGLAECFLELCYAEIGKYGYQGSSLKVDSWRHLREGIQEDFGLNFDQKSLKNHWDKEKKNYVLWREITSGTGGGVNYMTGEINWTEDKWDSVLQKHPEAKKFKTHPLKNVDLMSKVFEKITPGGEFRVSSSQDELPSRGSMRFEEVEQNNCSDSYWEDLNFESEQPTYSTQPSPANGSTSESSKKRSRNKEKHDDDIQKVISILEQQFDFVKKEKEMKRAQRAAEKEEEESYSLVECIEVLNMLRSFNNITFEQYSKAMVKMVESKECRKALMTIEKVEDKEAFVKALAMC